MGVIRNRAAAGSRQPGLVDTKAVIGDAIILSRFPNELSLFFDDGASSEYVVGPTMSTVGNFTTNFSVGIWFKRASDATNSFEGSANANSGNTGGSSSGWGFTWFNLNDLRFWVNNMTNSSNLAEQTTVSNVDQWHFAVGTYDANAGPDPTVNLYIDGVAASTSATVSSNLNGLSNNIELARVSNVASTTSHYYHGNLDEFAIWDVTLSQAEIDSLYNQGEAVDLTKPFNNYQSQDNLKLWWRCGDDGDSNTTDGIQDASGNGHTGTMTNMEDEDIQADTPSA